MCKKYSTNFKKRVIGSDYQTFAQKEIGVIYKIATNLYEKKKVPN